MHIFLLCGGNSFSAYGLWLCGCCPLDEMKSSHFSQNYVYRLSLCNNTGKYFSIILLLCQWPIWFFQKIGDDGKGTVGIFLMQKKYICFWINYLRGLSLTGSNWGGKMGKQVWLQALQEPEAAAQCKGRAGRQLFPPTTSILSLKRRGSWIMLHSCRWKVHGQEW